MVMTSNASAIAIIDAIPSVVLAIRENGTIAHANARAVATFGYAREELLGMPVEKLMPEQYRAGHRRLRAAFVADSGPRMMGTGRDLWALRKDGSMFPVEVGLAPARLDGELYVVVSLVDITARKHAEFQARWCEAIVISSQDAIISKTLDGIVTSWNPKARDLFGYSAEEMIGRSLLRLFPQDRIDEEKHILGRIQAGETVSHFETVRLHKNGMPIEVSATISPIRDETGRIVGASAIVRDVRARNQAERQLRENAQRLQAYRDRQEQENALARDVMMRQMRLPPDGRRYQYWVNPATTFSGDAISVAKSGSGLVYVLLADAAGHGLATAITTLPLLTIFHTMAERGEPIAKILVEANLFLNKNLPVGRFVAASILRLDFSECAADVWVGGMPDVLLLRAGRENMQRFPSSNTPLGIEEMSGNDFDVRTVTFKPGDQFFLNSDGVLEATDSSGVEFGEHRLLEVLCQAAPERRLPAVKEALLRHLGAASGHDDISLFVINC